MNDLLHTFAALAMIASALAALLPEGSLRRTAALAIGLTVTLCWVQGLRQVIALPTLSAAPDTALTASAAPAMDLSAARAVYARRLSDAASEAAGVPVTVTIAADGRVSVAAERPLDETQLACVREAIGLTGEEGGSP